MNCEIIQRRLLGVETPAHPPAEIQAHLDGCAACREWQGRLLQLEVNVPRLPVPASVGRDAFLKTLAAPESPADAVATVAETRHDTNHDTAPLPRAARVPARQKPMPVVRLNFDTHAQGRTTFTEFAWRWRYVASGAAAALLLFVFANWALRDSTTPAPVAHNRPRAARDPLVANLMQRNLTLVVTNSNPERAVAVAQIGEDLQRESVALAKTDGAEELVQHLARLRVRVMDVLAKIDTKKAPAGPVPGPVAPALAVDAQRIQQLRRNQGLIQSLVEGALRLATETDTLRRADSCNTLAHSLASEVRQAATARDGDRAIEMGDHLDDLLQRGIALNLQAVRKTTPQGSVGEQDLFRVRDWVAAVTQPLEAQLRLAADSDRDMHQALTAVHRGRTAVENAVRG